MGEVGDEADTTVAGVRQSVYLHWVKSQLDSENACLELPITILLLVVFSFTALLHLKQNAVLVVESGMANDISDNANFAWEHNYGNKNMFDVHTFADFWSWTRLGFLPLVIQEAWAYSEGYAPAFLAAAALRATPACVDEQPPATSMSPTCALQLADGWCQTRREEKDYCAKTCGACNETAVAPDVIAPNEQWVFGSHGPNANPSPQIGDYVRYNRMIGGLRFRQQVAPASESSCVFPGAGSAEKWAAWYGKPCMPAWEELSFPATTPDAEVFLRPERVEWMFLGYDSALDMLNQVIDMEDGCAELEAKNRSLCSCRWCREQQPPSPWLTEETQRLEISFASYNPTYGLISLTGVNFFFGRGGLVNKRIEVMSSWIDPLSAPWIELVPLVFFDVVWVSLLLYIFVKEVQEVVNIIRYNTDGCLRTLRRDYINFWNVVDWMSFIIACVVALLYFTLCQLSAVMQKKLEALLSAQAQGGIVSRDEYAALTLSFYTSLEAVCDCEKNFRLTLCVYPMMVMLRLFKSFAAQPRLAVVTETLKVGIVDIVHFFIVFMSVLCCLCLDSVLLFGQDLPDFATFPRSLHTSFRMMFGDWDWDAMEQVRRQYAYIWFTIFNVILSVILMNMLLAIVMESYLKVKTSSTDAITLPKQIQEMMRRYRQSKRKERKRLNEIYDHFLEVAKKEGGGEKRMLESSKDVNAEYLQKIGVPPTQATRTLGNADAEEVARNTPAFGWMDVQTHMMLLSKAFTSNRDELKYVYQRTREYDTLEVEPSPEEEDEAAFAKDLAERGYPGRPSALQGGIVSDDVIDVVNSEIGRLSSETASVLAQTMRQVDGRQKHIELRHRDMMTSVNEIQEALQLLQQEAHAVAGRLHRNAFERERVMKASNWRNGLEGNIMANCMDCTPSSEALAPRMALQMGPANRGPEA